MNKFFAAVILLCLPVLTRAQDAKPVEAMPGMKMGPGMKDLMDQMRPQTFRQQILHHASSGTSAEPNSTPTPMLMTMRGDWMVMFHANVFVTDIQQSGPRGADKFFSTSWFMPMAERGNPGAGAVDGAGDVQPGAGDCFGAAVSAAVSAGGDCVWEANCGWAASARLLYGNCRVVRPQAG